VAWQSRAAQRRAADPARLLGLDPPAEGVEVRAGEEPVPAEARDAMDSLRAQAAVALERTELAAELARRASVDPLTGLANRTAFSRRLREALAGHDEGGPPGDHPSGAPALLLLDLDDFKTINDSLGHSSGDEVLRVVAERLRSCLQPGDVAARLGGDEFAMLVPRVGGEAEAVALGQRLAAILRTPGTVAGREVLARASVGVRMARGGDEDPERLLRDADMAMYAAKTAGRAGVRVFDTAMHTRAVQRLDFEAALRRAVIRQQFTVRYQLVVELPDGGLAGLEALVRWDHPDRGPVMPGALGVHLAIDDFGTGYSALAYLKTLPVDTLKLAKPFVDGLLRGAEEAALTNAILRIADLLGLQVVAGGIEHEAQALELDRLGCPSARGSTSPAPSTSSPSRPSWSPSRPAAPSPRLPVV
jgi:diguanylate cyclase (GGDEF)-like protein